MVAPAALPDGLPAWVDTGVAAVCCARAAAADSSTDAAITLTRNRLNILSVFPGGSTRVGALKLFTLLDFRRQRGADGLSGRNDLARSRVSSAGKFRRPDPQGPGRRCVETSG